MSDLSELSSLKSAQRKNDGESVEKRQPFSAVGWNVNWCSHYGEQYGGSSKKLKIELPHHPTLGYVSRPN